MTKLGSRKLHICLKVTKMGSIIGHRIDCNRVGAMRGLRGLRHIPTPRLRLQIKHVFMYVWRRLVRDRRVTSLPELAKFSYTLNNLVNSYRESKSWLGL